MTKIPGISLCSHDLTAAPVADISSATQVAPSEVKLHGRAVEPLLDTPCPHVPPLHTGHVHAWSVDLDAFSLTPQPLLSADENERAGRLVRREHRCRFIQGRSILRILLGGYLQTDPATLRFAYGASGKPRLRSRHPGLFFNVSHHENAMLIAVTKAGAIGVDIEQLRALADESELVSRFFERAEISEYLGLPPSLRTAGFFNGWTRKEAILKARGDGLNTPLDSFSVSLDPREPCRIREFHSLPEVRDDWSLLSFTPDSGSTAALAVKARCIRLFQYRFGADRLEFRVTGGTVHNGLAAQTQSIQPNFSP